MTIYFATDHAGFSLKESLLTYTRDVLGHSVHDLGATIFNSEDDYPDIMRRAGEVVSRDPHTARAIILGGSGQGEAIVVNRFSHVRATVYYGGNLDIIRLSREHNDANILSLGARFMSLEEAKEAVHLWLSTPFTNEVRHIRRIEKID